MDSIRSASGAPVNVPQKAKKSPAPKKEKAASPALKDQVDIGRKEGPGIIHKMFSGAAKVVGGVIGTPIGAAKGGLDGAGAGAVHTPSPEVTRFMRFAAATAGLVVGLSMATTPVGFVVGGILGPIAGSAVGGAWNGLFDGAGAAAKGTFKGARAGAKKGIEMGGKAADWLVARLTGKPEQVKKS